MYTRCMALSIDNPEVEQQVRRMAALTGESVTDVVRAAVEERMARVRTHQQLEPKPTPEEMLDVIRSFNLKPVNENLTDDEILGYGSNGVCE
jgi:antitoxin VapB